MAENNNNNSANIEDLLTLAECPICSELKTDHRILVSCGHSFCLDDLEELVKKHPKPNCPLCRTAFIVPQQGIKSLIKDFHKIALVELALKWQTANFGTVETKDVCCECSKEATQWCQEEECGFCNEHAEGAHRFGKSKTHNLVHPSKKIVKVLCSSHKKELEKYCTTCNTVICMDCFVFEHVGHKIGTLESVAEDRKKALLEEWKTIADNLSKKLSEESNLIQETSNSVAQNLKEVKEKTTAYFDELANLLQQRKTEVLKMIEKKEDEQLELVARRKQILKSLEEIQMQTQALTSMSQKLSAAKWLDMEKSLRQDFGKWNHESKDLQVEKIEASLPDLKSRIRTVGLISKPQNTTKAISVGELTEVSFQLTGVAEDVLADSYPRGYTIIPNRKMTLSYVLVRLKLRANASIVLADNTGNKIQQVELPASQTEWYKAEFNIALDASRTYILMLVGSSTQFYFQVGTKPPRAIGDIFTIKSMYSNTRAPPFQSFDNTYQMQFRVGVVIH